jgi:hypothetical protein
VQVADGDGSPKGVTLICGDGAGRLPDRDRQTGGVGSHVKHVAQRVDAGAESADLVVYEARDGTVRGSDGGLVAPVVVLLAPRRPVGTGDSCGLIETVEVGRGDCAVR